MASFDFPASPNDNDTYSLNGVTYKYVAAKQRWEIVPTPHNFETTAQLDIRDTANRSRSNHTGTQTASTISDFDTEVSNNTDVAANTSARHDAVTVVDSSEIDFTLTGQQITASIVAGSIDESKLDASVNASLDLADSSVQLTGDQSIAGTKTFTTALILPNNSRINGVEHFYQTTKPTVRGDLSALVAGDRWWNTTDGTEWFWNGTYWLESLLRTISIPTILNHPGLFTQEGAVSTSYFSEAPSSSTGVIFISQIVFFVRFVPTAVGQSWTNQIRLRGGTPESTLFNFGTQTITSSIGSDIYSETKVTDINIILSGTYTSTWALIGKSAGNSGSGANIQVSLRYRRAA